MFALAPLVVLLPLAGFAANAFFGRSIGAARSGWLACAAAGGAFVVAALQAAALASGGFAGQTVPVAEWLHVGDLEVAWALRVDTLSVTMMLVVTGVGALIHLYALGYMRADVAHHDDPGRYTRFFVYLNLFLAMMLVLVSGDSLLTMFVGWEGVGLCSYLLIGFWFEAGAEGTGNARAAMKAFIVNRIGDFGLMLAMFLTFWTFGTLTFTELFERLEVVRLDDTGRLIVTAITLLLLLGATGKSAQLPLHVWLPDAMAGPTPVSALIHAATMVTAGIYMIARTHVLFELAPFSLSVVAWVGAATALFAATIAVAQMDIKRVLAYSTISQLGFMVAAVGLGGYVAALFHLVTHAFFKALLFLSSGSVIQALERGAHHAHDHADPQDMRHMGGLWSRLPITKWVYLAGALALAGLPPLAGFFSKDEILLDAFEANPAIFWVLAVAAFFTAFYMGRQLWMVFFGRPRSPSAAAATESEPAVTGPLVVLAVLAVLGGALNLPGVHTLSDWLGHTLGAHAALPFNTFVAGLSTVLALAGLGLAYVVYARAYASATDRDPLAALGPLFTWLRNKWYVDELYGLLVVRPFNTLSAVAARALDLGGIDMTAENLGDLARAVASTFSRFQLGLARRYALVMFTGVVLVLAYFLVIGNR
jgi:NADH-quinone oxidoreductase subunit L